MFGEVKRFSVFLAFAIISSSVSSASYSIKDLGLIGNPILNNIDFLVRDINDNGVISGTTVVLAGNRLERMATIVDSSGITTLTGLDGSSYAGGVNLSKQVAVTFDSQDFYNLGAVWSPTTNNPLQTFNNPNAVAGVINNHGNVSGLIEVSDLDTNLILTH